MYLEEVVEQDILIDYKKSLKYFTRCMELSYMCSNQ